MKAKIKEKREVAQATLEVVFDLLGESVDFKAGQFFFVTLPELNFPDPRGNRRHFSIVNSPNEKGILSNATRMRESGFKKTLKEFPVGSEVEVGPIAGSFILPDETDRPLVFIAGGIGITPFISMLKFIQEERLPYKITLIYSNRNRSQTAFFDELEDIVKQNTNIKLILTMTRDEAWQGEKRRIDSRFIKDYTSDLYNPLYYAAGPPPMVDAMTKALHDAGIREENIRTERFSGY